MEIQKAGKKERKLSIRVRGETLDDLNAVASLTGRTVQELVNGLVETDLERYRPALKAARFSLPSIDA